MDVTDRYKNMIAAFECDFALARDNPEENPLGVFINHENKQIMDDISLLEELSFGLRHGTLKIIE